MKENFSEVRVVDVGLRASGYICSNMDVKELSAVCDCAIVSITQSLL